MADSWIHRAAPLILLLVVALTAALYLSAGLRASSGATTSGAVSAPSMPLDDTYIHFQYARSLAEGYPYRYNPDQPATSGATSFLYPLLLAVGYRIGFQAERLAWWALLIGVLSWFGSAWLVYRIASRDGTSPESGARPWIGLGVALAFALSGSLGWAFMSGMETGLLVLATLLTLWYAVIEDGRGVLVAGTLAALIRPEGLVIALLAGLYMAFHAPSRRVGLLRVAVLVIPVLAALIQPALNLILTGSASASGLQAKSYLYLVPPDAGLIVRSIAGVAGRIWGELYSVVPGLPYVLPGLVLFGILTIIAGLGTVWRTRRLTLPVLVLCWLIGLTLPVAMLETAFWQFKRYQQPMIALLFPLAAWSLHILWRLLTRFRVPILVGALVGLVVFSISSTASFVTDYYDNVHEVASSQQPMTRYVAQTLPPGAVVGVHDIGVMRYLGGHATYDVIGLTTPGAARAWRNGPGTAYEQMRSSPWRPAYFAIYRDALGLSYLADTGLFREKLAEFPSTQLPHNIASATNGGQAVYKADWHYGDFAAQPWQPSSLRAVDGMQLVDSVNVADLSSEDAHRYRWWQAAQRPGFSSEVYEQRYVSCQPSQAAADNPNCTVLDGGRLMTGGEEMTIHTEPGQDLLWVTRVHPRNAVTLAIFVNGQRIAWRVIPPIPGQWLEIATLIPGAAITGAQTVIRAEANITDPDAGHYMPYYHWFYQGRFKADNAVTLTGPSVSFGRNVLLVGRSLSYNADKRTVSVGVEWQKDGDWSPSPATTPDNALYSGDAKLFIHLYDAAGKLIENAQLDQRPGGGALPYANWLPGTLRDSYTIVVPSEVAAGTYRVAIGLYDPASGERLIPTGEGADTDTDRHLFIGTLHIGQAG